VRWKLFEAKSNKELELAWRRENEYVFGREI
jgi:hypothetical protein